MQKPDIVHKSTGKTGRLSCKVLADNGYLHSTCRTNGYLSRFFKGVVGSLQDFKKYMSRFAGKIIKLPYPKQKKTFDIKKLRT